MGFTAIHLNEPFIMPKTKGWQWIKYTPNAIGDKTAIIRFVVSFSFNFLNAKNKNIAVKTIVGDMYDTSEFIFVL